MKAVPRKIYSTKCLHQNKPPKIPGVTSYHCLNVGPENIAKQEETQPRKNRWEEIITIPAENSKIETKQSSKQSKTTQGIDETKSLIFGKVNKIDKPLTKLTKRESERGLRLIKSEKERETLQLRH